MTDKYFHKLSQFVVFGECFIPTSIEAKENIEALEGEFIQSEYCLIPENEIAISNVENAVVGQVLTFSECTERDLKLHRCFFSLLNYIWAYMPANFRTAICKDDFYLFLKHLKREYKIVYKFKDESKKAEIKYYLTANKKRFRLTHKAIKEISSELGKTEMIEYESIAFGRMSEQRFRQYVRDQLPFIYSSVIELFYTGDQLNAVIDNIESEYEKFLAKINSR